MSAAEQRAADPGAEIRRILDKQRAAHLKDGAPSAEKRLDWLDRSIALLVGHKDAILDLAFSPDGAVLASAGYDRLIKLWDPRSGKELRTLRDHSDEMLLNCGKGRSDWATVAVVGNPA